MRFIRHQKMNAFGVPRLKMTESIRLEFSGLSVSTISALLKAALRKERHLRLFRFFRQAVLPVC